MMLMVEGWFVDDKSRCGVALRCVAMVETATRQVMMRRMGKEQVFERMGIGLLRERRQITKDPVVIPWWSGVVGFWGLRGASLSSSSRSSNVEGERGRELFCDGSQPSPSVGAGGDGGDGG